MQRPSVKFLTFSLFLLLMLARILSPIVKADTTEISESTEASSNSASASVDWQKDSAQPTALPAAIEKSSNDFASTPPEPAKLQHNSNTK